MTFDVDVHSHNPNRQNPVGEFWVEAATKEEAFSLAEESPTLASLEKELGEPVFPVIRFGTERYCPLISEG